MLGVDGVVEKEQDGIDPKEGVGVYVGMFFCLASMLVDEQEGCEKAREEWDAWTDCRVLLKVLWMGTRQAWKKRGAQQETSCGHVVGVGTIVGLSGGKLHDC